MAGAQTAWGVDVGVSSLKAIKLRRDGDRVNIEAFEVIEHDKFLTEPDVNRDALIRATLQKFTAKYAVRREVVFIGVPGSMAFARFVKLPPVETKRISEIVRFEAIQQIPFPLEQVNWDYHTFQHPESPDVEVGIFAMKKELVAQVMSNFRAVDMNVQGVQITPLAVYNAAAFDGMTHDKGTIVIDMGAEHTDLVILDQGRLWLRTINIGGNHFTEALAKSFKQPFARAESLKKTAATSKYQKQIYQAMRPIFADLVAEIQRSIGHYNQTHRDSRLDRIVGMGSPFKLPNLQKYLQQELKIDVSRLESFRMASVEKAAAFSEHVLSMTAAYGLAVQALGLAPIDTSLLPTELARVMMWKKKEPWFIGAAALIALGAVGGAAQWFMARQDFNSSSNEARRRDNNSRIASAVRMVDDWNTVTFDFDSVKKEVDGQFALMGMRRAWPLLIDDILMSLPQARGRPQQPIVVTEVLSEFSPRISEEDLATVAASGTTGRAGPRETQPIETTVEYGPDGQPIEPDPAAAEQAPADHGFVISVSGYAPGSDFRIVDSFKQTLVNRAKIEMDKPYYFVDSAEDFRPSGKQVTTSTTPVGGLGGIGGIGGIGGFGGVTPGATGTATPERPWGNVRGPYWSIFVPDLVGIRPPQTAQPVGLTQPTENLELGELPYAVDLYTTRQSTPPEPKGLNGYTFTLRFKVRLKDTRPKEPA